MSSQPPQIPQDDWTRTKVYAGLMLLAALLSAVAQTLVVPPAWRPEPKPSPTPTQGPTPQSSPSPVASPSASPLAKRADVCGEWRSETSKKQYDFVCQGQHSFEIYEVRDQHLFKSGSGTVAEDGRVEAEFVVPAKNRKANLTLKITTDGRRMEGSWRGEDPREKGRLAFHRI